MPLSVTCLEHILTDLLESGITDLAGITDMQLMLSSRVQMTNHLALWGFAEFAFCLTRMNPEMIYLHQDSGFLNVSYYKFDTDDVTGMSTEQQSVITSTLATMLLIL